jgi:hypothetical protein
MYAYNLDLSIEKKQERAEEPEPLVAGLGLRNFEPIFEGIDKFEILFL